MKNKLLHKSWVVVLAFLVLVSTTSLTLNQRFCGDALLESTLFTTLQKCTHTACSANTNHTRPSERVSKNCCKETSKLIKAQERLIQKEPHKKTSSKSPFQASLAKAYTTHSIVQTVDLFQQYSPPLVILENIQVRYQTFLI